MTPCPPSPDSTSLRSILGVDTCHPRPHSSGRRGSGRVDHYRNVPAILSNMAPRPPTVAAVITHGVSPFELSVACEVFGLDRAALADPLYRLMVRPLVVEPVSTKTGGCLTVIATYRPAATQQH